MSDVASPASLEAPVSCRMLLAQTDWSRTSLGPVHNWPAILKSAVEIALATHAQIVIFAGSDLVALYNDAYAPTIGNKHPMAFGSPARLYWGELWDDLEPLLRGVMTSGVTFSAKNRPFYIERHGYPETVYFDISYSALRDGPEAAPCAVLCVVTETTEIIRAREIEQRHAAIIASSDAAILSMDMDMIVTSWNRGAELLYGYSAQDMIGSSVLCLLPPDAQEEEISILRRIQMGERIDPHDTVRLHRDGRRLDVSLTVSPIHDVSGNVIGASKISRDISDRKIAERMQTTLVAEMKHRVKNIIATISAIARRTMSDVENQPQLQAFRERLGALARSQDLITRGTIDGADLRSLFEEVLAPYPSSSFSLEGPSLILGARTALTFALAMHELATNAAKYGALSVAEGRVSVSWAVQDGAFRLRWIETGGPLAEQPCHSGFGSILIETVLAQELEGTVTRQFCHDGLICEITAPLGYIWQVAEG